MRVNAKAEGSYELWAVWLIDGSANTPQTHCRVAVVADLCVGHWCTNTAMVHACEAPKVGIGK